MDDTGSDSLYEDDPQADADWLAGVGIGDEDDEVLDPHMCPDCRVMFSHTADCVNP